MIFKLYGRNGLLSMNQDEQTSTYRFSTDIAGGSFMLVSACTSGLLAQRMRKAPQYIDVSLFDATVALGAIAQGMYRERPTTNTNFKWLPVNYNVYECSDKKWIALGALKLKFWNFLRYGPTAVGKLQTFQLWSLSFDKKNKWKNYLKQKLRRNG
jgi:crotonobetainyl-CoA:carnitine CoA-transferase CaiB-like acyl-CoA transferase